MPDIFRVNFVYFQPYDPAGNPMDVFAAVEFTEGFTLSTGMKPDVNTARVSPIELAKLGERPGGYGSLLWYFANDLNGEPDMQIDYIKLIDVQPHKIGVISRQTGVQVVEWIAVFADWRLEFQSPRGGRLRQGNVNEANQANPTAAPTGVAAAAQGATALQADYGDGEDDSGGNSGADQTGYDYVGTLSNDPRILPNSKLMYMCFVAMGIDQYATVPVGVDSRPPPMNLQWHGSHAPTQLEKLLGHTGTIFCPHLDGTASIEFYGAGAHGNVPDELLIANLEIPHIDHRGDVVVFSTAPTAMMVTETIDLSGDDTWQFFVRDTSDQWKRITDNPDVFQGNKPIDLVNSQFAQLKGTLAEPFIPRLANELYRCIRLNDQNFPIHQFPVLRFVIEENYTTEIGVWAYIARDTTGHGLFQNTTDQVSIVCDALYDFGSTLHVRERLLQVDSSAGGKFIELSDGDLSVRFTHEFADDNNQPVYYEVAFERDQGGAPLQISPEKAKDLADNPGLGVVFIHRPHWADNRAWYIDGQECDHSDVDAAARSEAAEILTDDGSPPLEAHVKGFYPQQLSGFVGEVKWMQVECKTVFKENQFYRPTAKAS